MVNPVVLVLSMDIAPRFRPLPALFIFIPGAAVPVLLNVAMLIFEAALPNDPAYKEVDQLPGVNQAVLEVDVQVALLFCPHPTFNTKTKKGNKKNCKNFAEICVFIRTEFN